MIVWNDEQCLAFFRQYCFLQMSDKIEQFAFFWTEVTQGHEMNLVMQYLIIFLYHSV